MKNPLVSGCGQKGNGQKENRLSKTGIICTELPLSAPLYWLGVDRERSVFDRTLNDNYSYSALQGLQ